MGPRPSEMKAWKLAGIDLGKSKGDVWTRLAEAGCDAFTIAQLLGRSDVRVKCVYVRAVEGAKGVAVEAIKLSARKNVQVALPEK